MQEHAAPLLLFVNSIGDWLPYSYCTGAAYRYGLRRAKFEDETRSMIDAIDDPGLNYFALGLLLFIIIMMCYALIAIHDIPSRIAESRHHPHADAIHAAGWVSLFTLHVLWPFLWIWAMAYRPERGWGFSTPGVEAAGGNEMKDLQQRLAELEAAAGNEMKELQVKLAELEAAVKTKTRKAQ